MSYFQLIKGKTFLGFKTDCAESIINLVQLSSFISPGDAWGIDHSILALVMRSTE